MPPGGAAGDAPTERAAGPHGDGPAAWAAAAGVLWGLSYFFRHRLEATPALLMATMVSVKFDAPAVSVAAAPAA